MAPSRRSEPETPAHHLDARLTPKGRTCHLDAREAWTLTDRRVASLPVDRGAQPTVYVSDDGESWDGPRALDPDLPDRLTDDLIGDVQLPGDGFSIELAYGPTWAIVGEGPGAAGAAALVDGEWRTIDRTGHDPLYSLDGHPEGWAAIGRAAGETETSGNLPRA